MAIRNTKTHPHWLGSNNKRYWGFNALIHYTQNIATILNLIPHSTPPSLDDLKLKYSTFGISQEFINYIKSHYFKETGQHCSTFDVFVAKAWQARTRAVKLQDSNEVDHICFFANKCGQLSTMNPEYYYFDENFFYKYGPTMNPERLN